MNPWERSWQVDDDGPWARDWSSVEWDSPVAQESPAEPSRIAESVPPVSARAPSYAPGPEPGVFREPSDPADRSMLGRALDTAGAGVEHAKAFGSGLFKDTSFRPSTLLQEFDAAVRSGEPPSPELVRQVSAHFEADPRALDALSLEQKRELYYWAEAAGTESPGGQFLHPTKDGAFAAGQTLRKGVDALGKPLENLDVAVDLAQNIMARPYRAFERDRSLLPKWKERPEPGESIALEAKRDLGLAHDPLFERTDRPLILDLLDREFRREAAEQGKADERTALGWAGVSARAPAEGAFGAVGGVIQGKALDIENVRRELGFAPRSLEDSGWYQAGRTINELGREIANIPEAYQDHLWTDAMTGGGSLAVFGGVGLLGRAAGAGIAKARGRPLSAGERAVASYGPAVDMAQSSGVSQAFENVQEFRRDYPDLAQELGITEDWALNFATGRDPRVYGAIQVASVVSLLRPLTGGLTQQTVRRMIETGINEFTVENIGQFGQNMLRQRYDPDHPIWEQVPYAGQAAGIGAMMLALLMSPLSRGKRAATGGTTTDPGSELGQALGDAGVDLSTLYDAEADGDLFEQLTAKFGVESAESTTAFTRGPMDREMLRGGMTGKRNIPAFPPQPAFPSTQRPQSPQGPVLPGTLSPIGSQSVDTMGQAQFGLQPVTAQPFVPQRGLLAPEDIDAAAAEADTAPSEAQKEAGNYRKGHVNLYGLDITIENPRGSTRSGTDSQGRSWESTMAHHYGYIRRTEGNDGDHVDVFVTQHAADRDRPVFIVDQVNPETGQFDEHKVVMGAATEAEARQAYLANYESGWQGLGGISGMSLDQFKDWLKSGDTKKPVAAGETQWVRGEDLTPLTHEGLTPLTPGDQAPATQAPVETAARRQDDLAASLQNRDRSRANYQVQMNAIAANPDYNRVSVSRDSNTGAPMAFSADGLSVIDGALKGRTDTVTMSDGKGGTRAVPVQYAVVSAGSVQASHNARGARNPEYGRTGLTALNNGRTAGLQEAWRRGTTQAYVDAMIADTETHGVSPEAIRSVQNPMLIRLFDKSALDGIENPGAASNVAMSEALSDSEQAVTDARSLTPEALSLYQPLAIDSAGNRDFARMAARDLGATGDLFQADGVLSARGRKRIEAALLARAFPDASIITDLTEATDSDLKSLGGVLLDIAGEWSQMAEAAGNGQIDASFDITAHVIEAVQMVRKSRQSGIGIQELLGQGDMLSGNVHPLTEGVVRLFYRGPQLSRIRARDKISASLLEYARTAMTNVAGMGDMFGDRPGPARILESLRGRAEQAEASPRPAAQGALFGASGRPVGADPGNVGAQGTRQEPDGGRAEAAGNEQAASGRRQPVTAPKEEHSETPAQAGVSASGAEQQDQAITAPEPSRPAQEHGGETRPETSGDLSSQLAGMDDAALSALIDDVAASPKVPETSKPLKRRARKVTKDGKKQPKRVRSKAENTDTSKKLLVDRTAKQIASSMGVNLSSAGTEALKGLTELFGGKGKLSSGLTFDEDTYARAKPHFQQMMRDFDAAGRDLKDLIRAMLEAFGDGVKPYILRFAQDLRSEANPDQHRLALEFVKLADDMPGTITQARNLAGLILGRKIEPGTADAKMVDEAVELSVVMRARDIVQRGTQDREATYQDLVALYESMPNLSVRTSTSVAQQAYSTPAPLAYLAGVLAQVGPGRTVLDSSAGNGALLMLGDEATIIANELNPERAANLRLVYPGAQITQNDASTWRPEGSVDSVVLNPPFGVVRDAEGNPRRFQIDERYETGEIDHAIALKSLEAMADDGSAVLIVGSVAKTATSPDARSDAYNAKAKREFYLTLYGQYNVVDQFTVSGDLYSRQGAAWPVDVIVIRGRGKSLRKVPAADPPRIYRTWNDLSEVLNAKHEGTAGTIRREDAGDSARGQQSGRADAGTGQPRGGIGADTGRGNNADGDPGRVRHGPVDGKPTRARSAQPEPVATPGARADAGSQRPPQPGVAAKKGAASAQIAYEPSSASNPMGTLVPANMKLATQDALGKLASEVGDIDAYVAQRLGYDSRELGDFFGAEQIDAIALAVHNMEKGSGFIIGDQTGIGKGRVVAAVLRYAMRAGRVPVFVTEKANLYGDMYRDLTDIGVKKMLGRPLNILMTDSNKSVPLNEEKTEWLRTKANHASQLSAFAEDGGIGEYDVVFTTYSQMQTIGGERTPRHAFIEAVSRGGIVVLDESHNAGGTESAPMGKKKDEVFNRATFVRQITRAAHGAVYSSATYAKRPGVMDLYATTDMRYAVGDISELADLISTGGVPMQQVVASMLAQSGQYIRRERSFDGIRYNTTTVNVSRETYNAYSQALAAIQSFSERYVGAAAKNLDKQLKAEGRSISPDNSTGGAGASSTNFTAIMHNLVEQMLLSIKADAAADLAIESLKRGEKPVLTVASTMGAFIQDYADEVGTSPGDRVDISFNALLERYLDRTRRISLRRPFMAKGEKAEPHYLTDAELGSAGLAAFNATMEQVRSMDLDALPVSPIDHIHHRIREAGYRSVEITGRSHTLERRGDGVYYRVRPAREQSIEGRRDAVSAFNSGEAHAIILNQSGSTGLSLHASEKFKNRDKRRMIVVQPEKNIDTHMQMLGRVHRTGQIVLPEYDQLIADVPAERRPAAVLAKKMASLNANTTAARGSALTAKDAPDFMNEYGDEVAARMMEDDPDTHRRIGSPLTPDDTGFSRNGAVRKITGRVPLLPIEMQESLYEILESEYKALLEQKEAAGESRLEAKTLALDAITEDAVQVVASQNIDSPFADGVQLEYVDVKRLGKPYSSEKVREMVAAELHSSFDDETAATDYTDRLLSDLRGALEVYRVEALEDLESDKAKAALREKLNGQFERIEAILEYAAPGTGIRLYNGNHAFYGIVVKVEPSRKTKNPAALGGWKLTVAVADASKQMTLPLTHLYTKANAPPTLGDSDNIINVTDEIPSLEESVPIWEAFDRMQLETREKRQMMTGNLLAAYGHVNQKGQIVNFTDKEGNIRQGILMPRDYDYVKQTKAAPVNFHTVEQVLKFVQQGHAAEAKDKASTVSMAGDRIRIEIAAARARGGKYYLDPGVLSAAGQDFVKVGDRMRADLPMARAHATLEEMKRVGAAYQTAKNLELARKIVSGEADTGAASGVQESSDLYSGYERDTSQVHDRKRRPNLLPNLDLFDEAVRPTGAVQARAQDADNFFTLYRHAENGKQFRVGVERVTNAEEAAHVLSPIRKHAEEVFYALVLDKEGKILDVQMHHKGDRSSAPVKLDVVVPSVASVPGADSVWIAHNHPSGSTEASDADMRITDKLTRSMDGSNVRIAGHVIFGENGVVELDDSGTHLRGLIGDPVVHKIKPRLRKRTIPVTERMVQRRGAKDRPKLNSPQAAVRYAASLQSENALILVDNQHRPAAVLNMSKQEMGALRQGGAQRILEAIDKSNAAAAFIKTNDKEAGNNVGRYLVNTSVVDRMLDMIYTDAFGDTRSMVDMGVETWTDGRSFYSRGAEQTQGTLTPKAVTEGLEAVTTALSVPVTTHATPAAASKTTGLKIPNDANGFFLLGRMHLIASAHASLAEAEGTLWHEITHAGVAAVFGENAAGYMQAMNRIALHNANIRKAAAEWTRNFGADRLRDLNERGIKGERAQKIVRAHAIEEALADLSKAHGKDIKLKGLRQFIAQIVQWMRARGFKALPDLIERLTDAEALGMIVALRKAVMVGEATVFKSDTAAFSFAGERAETGDTQSLERAQAMVQGGQDADTVRKATGWFQGDDGRWRFEIDDSDAQWVRDDFDADVIRDMEFTAGLEPGVPLGDLLHHPRLFAAYPGLRSVRVSTDDTGAANMVGVRGGAGDGFIFLAPSSPGEMLSTLLHETQHAIQDAEGFARGGTAEQFRGTQPAPETVQAAKNLLEASDLVDSHELTYEALLESGALDPGQAKQVRSVLSDGRLGEALQLARQVMRENLPAHEKYRRLAGEIEARNVQARQKMTEAERRETSPEVTRDVPREDVIVVWNGKEMANAPRPENANAADIRFSRAEPDSAVGRQERGLASWVKNGQPIDRMFRFLFDPTGHLTDSAGRYRPSTWAHNKIKKALLEGKPKEGGAFGWMNPALENVRAGLIDRYGLDEAFVQREFEAQAQEAKILGMAEGFLKKLAASNVGPQEAKVLQAILTEQDPGTAEMQKLAEPIREAIDELGMQMVELGLLPREAYQRHLGKYLHRSYRKYESRDEGLPQWARKIMNKRRRAIYGDELKARGLKEDVTTERLLRDLPPDWWGRKLSPKEADKGLMNTEWKILDLVQIPGEGVGVLQRMDTGTPKKRTLRRVFWPADMPVPDRMADYTDRGTWKITGTHGTKLRMRRDFTKEERESMGEILDARYNIIKTFQLLSHDVANGRFFKDIAENSEWAVREIKQGETVADPLQARSLRTFHEVDWVKVPDVKIPGTGAPKWGALAGMHVRPAIWRDLNEMDKMQSAGTWRTILNQWKINKTARSPVVHMNNVMSNFVLMDLIDVRMQDLVRGIAEYRKKGQMWEEARDHGAFGAGFVRKELQRNITDPILDEILKEARTARDTVEGRTRLLSKMGYALWRGVKTADRKMVDFYQVEDELFRMATFMRHRSMGASATEAAQIARDQFLNYDIRAPWVNAARQTVLPFISYTYRAVPAIAQAIAHRPWKLAKYITIAYLANMLAFELEPGDEDEERRTMRPAVQGTTWASIPFTDIGLHRMVRMPFRDAHGNPQYLDVFRWLPAGDVFDTGQGQLGVPAWLQFGGPLQLAFEMTLNRSAFTGQDIVDRDTDTSGQAAEKRLGYLWKAWMPSAAYIPGSWHFDKAWSALHGERDMLGRPYSLPTALASGVGVKVQPHDVELGYYFRGNEIQRKLSAARAELNQIGRDQFRNIGTEASRERDRERAMEKIRRLEREARKLQGY